jgi:exo-1,4-beta-D-glucosaminidase
VRLEGKLEDDAFYETCDRQGVLVMAGWCCCSPWEQWKKWRDEQNTVAMESLRYQIRRARTHPSLIAFLNGSDNHPPETIEKQYLAIEDELSWPCPTISSATAKKSAAAEATGVKMEGPYKWEPPIYWLTDTKKGGAHGFNTEVGPGAVPPPLESLEQMLPKENRWPIDGVWNFHCGGGNFAQMKDFVEALDVRFGKSTGIADFSWKAQAQAYETIKAMYEAFRRNKFNTATGEIQWMLNNAWPSMIWHLYDYYWRPGAAYFATKQACEPVHILYSYDDRSIVVANDTLASQENLIAIADVYDIDAKLKHQQRAACSALANKSARIFTIPELADISTTRFLRLTLKDQTDKTISVNSYFLSTKPDVLDEKKEVKDDWAVTPCSSYADYTQLEKLPKVDVTLKDFAVDHHDDEDEARVTVTNTSNAIALLVRLKLTNGKDGDEILPIRWQDNYFMLLPNESRQITARYLVSDAEGKVPQVSVECFNNARV